jgi:hypothetical protein
LDAWLGLSVVVAVLARVVVPASQLADQHGACVCDNSADSGFELDDAYQRSHGGAFSLSAHDWTGPYGAIVFAAIPFRYRS